MDKPFKAFTKYTAGVVRFIRRPQYNAYAYRSTMRTPIVVQRVWLPSYNQQKIKIVGARWCKKKRYTIKSE